MTPASASEFLWYIPNTLESGHRGDFTEDSWGSLEFSLEQALLLERHGWGGALLGTSWGRPDTFTVATAVAARTTSFIPLVAIRPGYWAPAQFATAAATLYHLTGGRLYINIVTGVDDPAAYGDGEFDRSRRYDRTREFLHIVRRLWAETDVTELGEFWSVRNATVVPRLPDGHPRLYFGGASAAAERVAAAEADVQMFWGEPLDGIAERIDRLTALQHTLGREHPPLEYGLRITTFVRDTTEEAWRDAEAKVRQLADQLDPRWAADQKRSVGQQRLVDLQSRGEVLDTNLYTTPGRVGGGGAGTTWLVGTAAEVAAALQQYAAPVSPRCQSLGRLAAAPGGSHRLPRIRPARRSRRHATPGPEDRKQLAS